MIQQKAILRSILLMFYPIHAIALLISWGCAAAPPVSTDKSPPAQAQAPPRSEPERPPSDRIILRAIPTDTYESFERTLPGKDAVEPSMQTNPGNLHPEDFLIVPVLVYHRISSRNISMFDRQMAYLKNHGYSVLSMRQFLSSMEHRRSPPKKSVLLTIDGSLKSTRNIANPILKKYGFSASLIIDPDVDKIVEPQGKATAKSIEKPASIGGETGQGTRNAVNPAPKPRIISRSLPKFAFLKVRTVPNGAAIYINGVQRGTSPATIKLDLGKYHVKLCRSGYRDLACLIRLDRMTDYPLTEQLRPFKDH